MGKVWSNYVPMLLSHHCYADDLIQAVAVSTNAPQNLFPLTPKNVRALMTP